MFQTNHLVIIGGPSAVGKSSLQTRILQGDMPSLCKQLCVDLPSSYLFIDAHELPEVRQKCVNHLILHYDFLTQYSIRDGYAYLPDLISTSCRVIALTLCTSSNLLFHRIYLRLRKAFTSFLFMPTPHNANTLLRLWKKWELCKSTSDLQELYEHWSVFIERRKVPMHLIIDPTSSEVLTAMPYEVAHIERILKGAAGELPV